MTVTEKKKNSIIIKDVSDFLQVLPSSINIQMRQYTGVPSNFYYIESHTGHAGAPGIYWHLYGYDSIDEGPSKHLYFSNGTVVGSIVGIIVGFIPGINAISVITALGGAIAGGIIGSYIDGDIYAIDYYTDLIVSVKSKVTLSTHRYTRYAKVINNKTGRQEEQYIGRYGNWNDNKTLIYEGLQNYVLGFY